LATTGVPLIVTTVWPPPPAGALPAFGLYTHASVSDATDDVSIFVSGLKRRPE
jgi:hypothetical protein